ncbi:ech hydrogenase subunit B [Butyrivibrio sp. INlla18]|jgi:ech hydrogenase subunit B|uniref:complex I subunit 1 family protein n=1 Tax=unclassified Butyrivibrio TaxID=2639466 RepID=UPI000888B28B|nr:MULTISPECIES: complex I subunit 1 family protein [unclassified Butyrivibrio]MBE5840156.1 NADH-quinone oxidoreductase subunit H [Butyrivibrio sp.]MCR4756339.1 NADH-quinone oxidoreductase subunit H [Butyrivibrio sp.]SDA64496.1 ech hydrogenase subunit B [Butyrivibrio sp. INlla18]
MTLGMFIKALIYILLAPLIGGTLAGLDRIISARMQGRQGPPLFQPFYDVFKLLNKQTTVVNSIQVLFVTGYLIMTIFTGALFFAGGDMLLVFFALSMSEVVMVMAAFSTNGPYSIMGAQRELLQMMCYEPMTLLVAIGFYYANGSFMVDDLIQAKIPAIAQIPGFFIGFVFILIIKLRKSPFDLSTSHHMHQEMVKGLTTDLSGNNLAFVEIAEWYDLVLMMGIVGMFFITANPISRLWAILACSVVFFLETLIDNLFPRVKYITMLKVTWSVILIFAGTNLLILNVLK